MDPAACVDVAREAKSRGVTRMCMGAAWREAPQGKEFENVLEMVRGVSALGMEVCCTLGMLTEAQAVRLKDAGLTAYNHNLDTSPEFYGSIITTRVYEERLKTLASVRKAGITVCCGGILGMGEKASDRIGLLHQLATLRPHPESVPINMLVRVEGTPLGFNARAGSPGDGASDRHRANPDAGFPGASGRRAETIVARSGHVVLSRWCEFDIRRREVVDHTKSRPR